MQRFYITTPLYYVNDIPHIGHAYTTITADVLNRYFKLFGYETYFLTGTDEHGQKVDQAARERQLDPQTHCDQMSENFKRAWDELEINYDLFFRTTASWHKEAVQKALQLLYDKGEIYADTYEGWYSVSEEIFYNEKDLVDGKSPTGKAVQKITEKNYFFRMSKYQNQLIEHIEKNPDFIKPESRRNEVLGFLRKPLGDLCISRPKTRLQWGVEIPFDREYVTYVWFDALLNYATGVGYLRPGHESDFDKWWQDTEAGAHHLIGKDILTTHSVYWCTMLMALGLSLPRQIFAHGWILNKDQGKMSKSEGDVVSPLEMKDLVGVEALRYFLVREIHLGNDGPFSKEILLNRINNELANNLGNLLSRTTNLVNKYFDGKAPQAKLDRSTEELKTQSLAVAQKLRTDVENMRLSQATEHVVLMLNHANRYLEERAPWKQAKTDVQLAGHTLAAALEVIRIAGILLRPIMPQKMDELLKRIGCQDQNFAQAQLWDCICEGTLIEKGQPLFPRIEG